MYTISTETATKMAAPAPAARRPMFGERKRITAAANPRINATIRAVWRGDDRED